ncbi:hypothetical protein PR048_004685 [Dryococelus australis]|uniref:HAT C-terminal dimerisation domain-containing protein n=1 Tax=Dryococelus australis TaxID=614101 RepID=A0ABQ9I737_9NEOP|nr:hypothetical protein PR048_004685 [Dryococelus australis]
MKNRHPTVHFLSVDVVSAHPDDQQHGDVSVQDYVDDVRPCNDGSPRTLSMPSTSKLANAVTFKEKPVQPKNQTDITDFVTINKPLPVKRAIQIDKHLVRMVVKGYYPFSLVEDEELKNFVHILSPAYHLPTRKTLSTSLISRLYMSVREKVKLNMNEASAVCMTTDSWTFINNESFVAVTVHFVDSESKLSTFLLGCITFNERHTAENPNAHQAKQLATPTVFCTVNLVVQSSLQTINAIEKIKTIVAFFKRSSSALAKLKSTEEQMGLPSLKLIQANLHTGYCQPRTECSDNNRMRYLAKSGRSFAYFSEVTTEFSAEKSVSVSKIIFFYESVCDHVMVCSVSRQPVPEEVKNMCSKLTEQLKKRLKDCESNELYAQTTLLDPGFKKFGFTDNGKYEAAYTQLWKKVCVIREPAAKTNTELPHAVVATALHSQSSLWKSFDMTIQKLTPCDPTVAEIVETDKYMQEPLLNSHENPLDWWCDIKCLYPRLYELVQWWLCIIPTSVPCERIFSKAGQMLTERRNCLSSSKKSELLFLHSNIK